MVLCKERFINLIFLSLLLKDMQIMRKTTSLKIDDQIWKEVKIHCIKEDCEISQWLEDLIKDKLKIGVGKK
jgi:hypothetical protein